MFKLHKKSRCKIIVAHHSTLNTGSVDSIPIQKAESGETLHSPINRTYYQQTLTFLPHRLPYIYDKPLYSWVLRRSPRRRPSTLTRVSFQRWRLHRNSQTLLVSLYHHLPLRCCRKRLVWIPEYIEK